MAALTPRSVASGRALLAVHPTQGGVGPNNRLQRDVSRTCVDCGAPVIRARRARGPLPRRCLVCTAARRPRAQLRAYLRAAGRLAEVQGLAEVSMAIDAALIAYDNIEVDR